MKTIPARLFVFGFFLAVFIPSLIAQKAAGTYYIIANAGLNLRMTEASNSEKLATVPYGAQVELVQMAGKSDMTVDGLKGGMAKVKYKDQTGYMFDGYLVRFPAPIKGEEMEKYVGRVWEQEIDVMKETVERDYGGYMQSEHAIYISDVSWADAFLLAKNEFGIPTNFQFPGDTGSGKKVSKNPNADKNAWTDELTAEYENGKLKALYYSYRTEGFGNVIGVERAARDSYEFRVYELGIADWVNALKWQLKVHLLNFWVSEIGQYSLYKKRADGEWESIVSRINTKFWRSRSPKKP